MIALTYTLTEERVIDLDDETAMDLIKEVCEAEGFEIPNMDDESVFLSRMIRALPPEAVNAWLKQWSCDLEHLTSERETLTVILVAVADDDS